MEQESGPRERMMEAVRDASMPAGSGCCGKPVGCTMTHRGCLYLAHPWKRAQLFGDTTVRCQKKWLPHGAEHQVQCSLNHGHAGPCAPGPPEAQPRRGGGFTVDL